MTAQACRLAMQAAGGGFGRMRAFSHNLCVRFGGTERRHNVGMLGCRLGYLGPQHFQVRVLILLRRLHHRLQPAQLRLSTSCTLHCLSVCSSGLRCLLLRRRRPCIVRPQCLEVLT